MKALLVIDIPNNLDFKWLSEASINITRFDKLKNIHREAIVRPIPQKVIETDDDKTYNENPDFYDGFNACIDELIGEEK